MPWCTICCLATGRKTNSSVISLKGVQFSSCLILFWSLKILFFFTYCFCLICPINSGSMGEHFLFLLCDLFSLINVNNMGCKDSMFQLQRNTSWAQSVNCIWNRTNPSCLSFVPADSCTVISFVLLAAKAANPRVLEYVKKFTPEGRCILNSYLATLMLEEKEKKRWGLISWKPE